MMNKFGLGVFIEKFKFILKLQLERLFRESLFDFIKLRFFLDDIDDVGIDGGNLFSGENFIIIENVINRKRFRKGKVFKLDIFCLKL